MRKISILLFAAAMALLAASCVKEQPSGTDGNFTLTVNISSEKPAPLEVKTYLGATVENNKRKVYWSNGDAIRVNGVASNALAGLADDSASASFTFASAPGLAPYNILYPAGIYENATHVALPAVQTYKSGTFADGMFPMAGYSVDGSNISVHHLCAVLKVNILRKSGSGADEHDLVSATFRGLASEQVSGIFDIDYQNATLTATSTNDADKKVKVARALTTSTSTPATYYLVVPARTYSSGIAIDVQDKGGDLMTLSKAGSVTFEAGKLYDMQEVPFERTGDAPATLTITTAQELIAFATAYNAGTLGGDDLVVALGNDIVFDAAASSDFNTTGGIGASGALFNGLFDGAGYSINGLAATVPVFARVGKNGTVKNLTMGSTSSLSYSADISDDTCLGAIVGYSKGNIADCTNNAPVSCSSANRTDGVIYLGGVVGRQNETGVISGCTNNAAVSCSTATGTKDVYIGGIVGSVERPAAANTANIQNCINKGAVKSGVDSNEPAQTYPLHIAGVVGWIHSTSSSAKMTVTGLTNTGNVTKTNNSAAGANIPVFVAGIVAGIHGAEITTASGQVAFTASQVEDCTIQNGDYNNATGYDKSAQTGGFVGVARGNSTEISFSNNCYVKHVSVICRRSIAGGFAATAQGASFDGCNVLGSSVQGTLAQCRLGGGIVGYSRGNITVKDCTVTLTKNPTYSLYGNATTSVDCSMGGIIGSASGTNSIEDCKIWVKRLYIGTAKTKKYGWVVGDIAEGSTTTIKDCGIGGTYGNNADTETITTENYASYLVSASSTAAPTLEGTNYCWNGGGLLPKSVETTITDYATDHTWTGGGTNYYSIITLDDVTITASSSAGQGESGTADTSKNGVYNAQWRFYQARGGGITVSVPDGHSLLSATFTYGVSNTGVLIAPDGSTQVSSGTNCSLSGTSAFFGLGNTGTATNGQCRITKIVVDYE